MLRTYKFTVTAVPQIVDEEGHVTGEAISDPVTVFGVEALVAWAQSFEELLEKADNDAVRSS